jgi:hypothetical protein
MDNKQGSVLESIRAVQNFLDAHADQLGEMNKTGVRQQLDQVVTQLTGHVTSQKDHSLASLGATRKQRALRRVLIKEHMRPIARIATADLPPTPEVQPLTMPAGHPTAAVLIAAARGMAAAAERFATVFTGAGLPADFVAQLTTATEALEAARDQQTATRSSRAGSTDVLAETLQRGRRIVRVLDSLVSNAVKDNAELLAAWKSAKRIRQTGRPSAVPGAMLPTTPKAATPNAAFPSTPKPEARKADLPAAATAAPAVTGSVAVGEPPAVA